MAPKRCLGSNTPRRPVTPSIPSFRFSTWNVFTACGASTPVNLSADLSVARQTGKLFRITHPHHSFLDFAHS